MAAFCTLDGGIDNAQTAVDTSGFPVRSVPFILLVEDELIKVTELGAGPTVFGWTDSVRGFGPSVEVLHAGDAECFMVVGVVGSGTGYVVNFIGSDGSVQTRDVNTGLGGGSGLLVNINGTLAVDGVTTLDLLGQPLSYEGGAGVLALSLEGYQHVNAQFPGFVVNPGDVASIVGSGGTGIGDYNNTDCFFTAVIDYEGD